MKRKPTRKSLRNKLDKIVSEITRSKGYCVWCHDNRYEKLQAAHIFSRKNLSCRWMLDNVMPLCIGCHFKAHQNPILFAEFCKTYLGDITYEMVKKQAQTIVKWTIQDLQEMLDVFIEFKKGDK